MLTWEEICRLTPHELRHAIDRIDRKPALLCPDYTGAWDACMPLAWRYGIDVLMCLNRRHGTTQAIVERLPGGPIVKSLSSEADVRLAICRLAVWAAQQEQEPSL